ncbi:MAG: sulfite exporter TauE/SafE family protein [Methanobacteriaceae archaeon]|nr:sulfite exporter TauE/SafE family protein [Methanobacteriaceae archaeon]
MEINIIYLFILAITGIAVGFFTGLLGVGGGFILAPIQFFLLQSLGVDTDTAIRMAFGTSLAVMFPTALSGVYTHHKNSCVLFKPVIYLGLAGFFGGILGGFVAAHTPGAILKILFGILIFLVVIQFLKYSNPNESGEKILDAYHLLFYGFIAGFCSGLLGIGGGIILVPIMVILLGFRMIEAVGTSTAVIVLTSLGGIIAYTFNGLGVPGLPEYSVGYINLLQFVVLAGFSIPMAKLGAGTAQKLPENYLRYIFSAILIYIGLKMIGVFEFLRIPI